MTFIQIIWIILIWKIFKTDKITFGQNQFLTCYYTFNFRLTFFNFWKMTANSIFHNVQKVVQKCAIPVVKELKVLSRILSIRSDKYFFERNFARKIEFTYALRRNCVLKLLKQPFSRPFSSVLVRRWNFWIFFHFSPLLKDTPTERHLSKKFWNIWSREDLTSLPMQARVQNNREY